MFYDALRSPGSTEEVIETAVLYARSAAALLPLLNDYDHPDWEPIRGMFVTKNEFRRCIRSHHGNMMISDMWSSYESEVNVYMQHFISDISYFPHDSTFRLKSGKVKEIYNSDIDVNSESDIFMKSTVMEYRPLFCAAYFSTLKSLNIQQSFTILPMGLEYAIDAHPEYMDMMRSKL